MKNAAANVTLNGLGTLHTATGDYPAAAASLRQALAIFRDLHVPCRPRRSTT